MATARILVLILIAGLLLTAGVMAAVALSFPDGSLLFWIAAIPPCIAAAIFYYIPM